MKVRTISPVRMLCISDVNCGSRYNDPDYEYIGGESEGGYGYGVPD